MFYWKSADKPQQKTSNRGKSYSSKVRLDIGKKIKREIKLHSDKGEAIGSELPVMSPVTQTVW